MKPIHIHNAKSSDLVEKMNRISMWRKQRALELKSKLLSVDMRKCIISQVSSMKGEIGDIIQELTRRNKERRANRLRARKRSTEPDDNVLRFENTDQSATADSTQVSRTKRSALG